MRRSPADDDRFHSAIRNICNVSSRKFENLTSGAQRDISSFAVAFPSIATLVVYNVFVVFLDGETSLDEERERMREGNVEEIFYCGIDTVINPRVVSYRGLSR